MSESNVLSGFGLGLRQPHYDEVLKSRVPVDWFEILPRISWRRIRAIGSILPTWRKQYPLVLHGVAMNIGRHRPARCRLPREA